jgi:hypothetical protein
MPASTKAALGCSIFGSPPRALVPDNLKAGVNEASFYDPEINHACGAMASLHSGIPVGQP